jgi:hypothetical protein
MPLITSWANRDAEILDDRSVEQRTYRVGSADDFIDYKEVVEKNVNRWVGFTEAAASAHIDTNEQPADISVTNSWAMNEDQRVVGSYTITRTQEKKTTSVVGTTPPPVIGSVDFSVASTNNTTFPFNLTLSTSVAGAVIRYRLDSYLGNGIQTGSWQTSSGQSQTISVTTNNSAFGSLIGGVSMHKYIIIEAYAYRELQTGTYEGPRSKREYGYRAPSISAISFGLNTNTNTTFPVSLPVSLTPTDAQIKWFTTNLKSNGIFNQSSISNASSGSNLSITERSIYAAGRVFNGVSYHAYAVVNAYGEKALDGVSYTGPTGTREFGRRAPTGFVPTFNPAGETTQLYFGTTLPTSVSLSKPNTEPLTGEIAYTWYYYNSSQSLVLGGSGVGASPTFNVSAGNNSYEVFNFQGYQRVVFQTIVVAARGDVFLNNIKYNGPQENRWYTRFLSRTL